MSPEKLNNLDLAKYLLYQVEKGFVDRATVKELTVRFLTHLEELIIFDESLKPERRVN